MRTTGETVILFYAKEGGCMKNKLHYVLIPVYVFTVIFILYINGVFTGNVASSVNLIINVGFLLVMGVLLAISFASFVRVNRCTEELVSETRLLQKEYEASEEKNLCVEYLNRKDVFTDGELKDAFTKYQFRMKKLQTRRGYKGVCDIEEYINEDLVDRIGKNFYNSNMPGTLTGLGILGTFLGLSMGLASFSGEDILTISDSMGPLLEGMKVAFHTSVYGIFLSLVFSFIYKAMMADAYTALENFQNVFRQFAMPAVATEEENLSAMIIYQANMSKLMKQMLELLKGEAKEQNKGVERIVDRFMDRMTETMGEDFRKLGSTLKNVTDAEIVTTRSNKELIKAVEMLVLANRDLQEKMNVMMETQEHFAEELKIQKKELAAACDQISDEISSQLYAFDKMRNLYEK